MKSNKRLFCLMLGFSLLLPIVSVSADEKSKIVEQEIKIKDVSSYLHTAVLTEEGRMYAWGLNALNEVSISGEQMVTQPTKVMDNVKTFSVAENCSAVVNNEDELYVWGINNLGQAGINDSNYIVPKPTKVMDNVKSVGLGGYMSLALTNTGDIYQWGAIDYNTNAYVPVKLCENMVKAEIGYTNKAALDADGNLYVWGENGNGELGVGSETFITEPTKIMGNIVDMDLAQSVTAAITKNGELYTWGINSAGCLGNETTENNFVPTKIMDNVKDVSMGREAGMALLNDGSVYVWGSDIATPYKVLENIKTIECGYRTYFAVTNDGELYGWGINVTNQINDSTEKEIAEPTKISIYEKCIESGIMIDGFQVNATKNGVKTIYSVEPEIDGQKVIEKGLVYGLSDYTTESDMYVGCESEYVESYESTEEKGLFPMKYSESDNASTYVTTMLHEIGDTSEMGLTADYSVRAYAKLENGKYVYSDIEKYSIYGLSDYLYKNNLVSTEAQHNYLYDNILSVVNPEYEYVEYINKNTYVEAD